MSALKTLTALCFCLLATATIAQDTAALISPCVECHGSNGVASKPATPHIDGQMAGYLADSLRAFNDGTRKTAVDQHKGIPREVAKALAGHYSAQKISRAKSPVDPALLARGDELYLSRCADCHPDNGRESDKDAPLMAGQDLDYLIVQTLAFKKGERRFAVMMDDAYKGLSETDLKAVAHFFAAQDPVAPTKPRKKRR